MDKDSGEILANLLCQQRVAALGTLFHGAPLVSMVLFSVVPGSSAIDIHISRLAQHTQGLLEDARVGLMIAEPDRISRNPQTLARLSLQGDARGLARESPEYEEAMNTYLEKHPTASINFQLGDFLIVRIEPRTARLVTGFGRIFDLSAKDLKTSLGPAG
jgi:putative heme iron utilization protein